MKPGSRVQMERPGVDTPVPVGTWGKVVAWRPEGVWELAWDNGVSTTFPNAHGDHIALEAIPGEEVCDFCTSSQVRWEHRAHDAQSAMLLVGGAGALGQGSHGSWAACEVCHRLIELGKRDELVRRSAKRFQRQHPGVPFRLVVAAVTDAHRMYWNNRIGSGIRYLQEER